MKRLNLSAVSTSIGFPVKHGTMDFLQASYKEALGALAQNIVGADYDPAKFYILFGCVATGTDPGARTISAGAVFFNGEIYLVPAYSGTTTGSDVLVGTLTRTFFADPSADPVTFTDGVNRSVHEIWTLNFAPGASGSADVDFDDLVDKKAWQSANSVASFTLNTSAVATITSAALNYLEKDNEVILNYKIVLNVTNAGTGNGALVFALPVNCNSTIKSHSTAIFLTGTTITAANAETDQIFGNGFLALSNSGAYSVASYTITGQIIYLK